MRTESLPDIDNKRLIPDINYLEIDNKRSIPDIDNNDGDEKHKQQVRHVDKTAQSPC